MLDLRTDATRDVGAGVHDFGCLFWMRVETSAGNGMQHEP